MNDTSSDDTLLLKQRFAEQEGLNRTLLEKLVDLEREIDRLQVQLDKLRRMNFNSRSEKGIPLYCTDGSRPEGISEKSDALTVGLTTRLCSGR